MSACSTRHEHCFHRWHGELCCRIKRIYSLPAYITFLRSKFTQGGGLSWLWFRYFSPSWQHLASVGVGNKTPALRTRNTPVFANSVALPAPRLLPQPPAGPAPFKPPSAAGPRGAETRDTPALLRPARRAPPLCPRAGAQHSSTCPSAGACGSPCSSSRSGAGSSRLTSPHLISPARESPTDQATGRLRWKPRSPSQGGSRRRTAPALPTGLPSGPPGA